MQKPASKGKNVKQLKQISAVVWFIVTTVLLVIPGNALPKGPPIDVPFFDKWVHVLLFAILAWLWCAFAAKPADKVKILVGAIVYGIAMEFVQKYLVVNRSFDLVDIIADSIGVCLGVWAAKKPSVA
ncbi:MAG: VanZ family protein [Chitinophagaceae bacterium]|jgi:VanZ family protein|nr:VanZ family protein [Chitinophagaceae bacterium]